MFIKITYFIETGCEISRADILFVLDSSGSIGQDDYRLMKKFVKDIVSICNVGSDKVRIGLIIYSSSVDFQFGIGTHRDVTSVKSAIDGVPYYGGGTATHLALRVSDLVCQ